MKAEEFRESLDIHTGYNPAYNERTYTESQVDDIMLKFSEHQNKALIEQLKNRDDLLCQLLTEILKQDMLSPIGHLQEIIKRDWRVQ